jgi:VWFA-related protein
MKYLVSLRAAAVAVLLLALVAASLMPGSIAAAQSGRQPPKKKVEKKTEEQKPGQPPKPEEQEPAPPIPRNLKDEQVVKLSTQIVNVDITVIDKKSGRLYPNLTQKNFTIYEDGVKQEVTNFRSGEGPMTAVLLLENNFGRRFLGGYFDPSVTQEVFQSAAVFVQRFVKQEDNIAIVTFSLKPKVIQDFTNDANRLYGAIVSAYRDTLNFSESNVYDALSFVLVGGKAIQLFDEDAGENEYNGLEEVEGHTAVILITMGIDTFSKITFDKALKIAATAGVPVFTISVGNLFFKKNEHRLSTESRLNFLQAQNQLKAFADRTGGSYFEMTFEGQIPAIMQSIEAILRTQYSLGYEPTNSRREGKERKIQVEVDVNGDGQPDNKQLDLRFRQRYFEPNDNPNTKQKK